MIRKVRGGPVEKIKTNQMCFQVRRVAIVIALVCGTAAAQPPHTLTGDIRFHKNVHSNILNSNRDVIVYLPPGYEAKTGVRYAVLYMHDGQNIFDGATSFIPGQEWRVDETAESLISAGKIEPLIIVGIYNAGANRVNEYTPAEDARHKVGGKADLYGRMLVEELKPFIDSTYRTRKGAKHTALGGSSLGGLVSLYLGLKYPNVFGKLAVVSPFVWWADNQIVHYTRALPRKPLRIWLDIGTKEGRDEKEAQNTTNGARLLRDTLIRKGWKFGKNLKYLEADGAEHNERAWAARVSSILQFLFPKK
ncbi:MAG TPA: alpha/beta hydrolase-fold protein [Pyrinomonadaceae bacterium]|nr:alpha/beta hydrolase-fold protein [Pyrinomonadaceae bacterium]